MVCGYTAFHNISVISGQWKADNDRLCATESRLQSKGFRFQWADRWIDDLRFYVLFNSVAVISGRSKVDNERL